MISSNVNKTSLHPAGVTPYQEHTELEQELHDIAHIDYDRVAIVSVATAQLFNSIVADREFTI